MRILKTASAFLIALTTIAGLIPDALAAMGNCDSITVTIDRKTHPNIIFHPELWKSQPSTVKVHDFMIRDYYGNPIDGFVIQTASGRTEIPVDQVKEIHQRGWITRARKDIEFLDSFVKADITLVDGTTLDVLMNADFGTIEGKTELGDFYLGDPHTVKMLVFNREERVAEAPQADVSSVAAAVAVEPESVRAGSSAVGKESDSDGDGVADSLDKCPNTLKGAPVDSVGCWSFKGISFDFRKWNIKPEFEAVLDGDARVLGMNPEIKIDIQGHTDNVASEKFNQKLSEKRAESAKEYFVSKGIAPDRISTVGFGESRPATSNDTPDGRAQNRRIEIKVVGE
ncbi:OmpA family protein [Candidatus Poribacteria bacterium]|nr:OmpA family protein [Candidatus Poribacteria bacterium]